MILFYVTVQTFRIVDYFILLHAKVHDIKRADINGLIIGLSIHSCYHSNHRRCSDTEGLADRINETLWRKVL